MPAPEECGRPEAGARPNAGRYSGHGAYEGHSIVDPKPPTAVILVRPRVVTGSNKTTLGYEFELDTCRDVLASETGGQVHVTSR